MGRNNSNLLFLAIGAAVGAAVGYVVASDKKEEWIEEINHLVNRVKGSMGSCCSEVEEELTELSENEE